MSLALIGECPAEAEARKSRNRVRKFVFFWEITGILL